MIYAIIMFATALLLLVLGFAIYRGHTGLIHDYHQEHIPQNDLPAYGREFSVGMFSMIGTFALSGIIPMFGESGGAVWASLGVLAVGFIVSFVILARVQKKFNGGFF